MRQFPQFPDVFLQCVWFTRLGAGLTWIHVLEPRSSSASLSTGPSQQASWPTQHHWPHLHMWHRPQLPLSAAAGRGHAAQQAALAGRAPAHERGFWRGECWAARRQPGVALLLAKLCTHLTSYTVTARVPAGLTRTKCMSGGCLAARGVARSPAAGGGGGEAGAAAGCYVPSNMPRSSCSRDRCRAHCFKATRQAALPPLSPVGLPAGLLIAADDGS